MRSTILILIFSFLSTLVMADDELTNSANTYEKAAIPNFLPFVGKGLAGRCYHTSGGNQQSASVLMVSFEEDGFDLAPFDAERTKIDIFDKMKYEEILKLFPIIKKMFLEVSETADGAVIEKEKGALSYRGEIRESQKYMIMRVFINDKLFKYCNYVK